MNTESVNSNANAKPIADSEPLPGNSRLFASLERSNFLALISMALFVIVFVPGALSWHRFFVANYGPVGLFTQTDFPGIVIGSRLVSSGHGAELYNFNLQLREQKRLIDEGEITLSPADSAQLKYPYPYSPFLAVLWSPFTWLPPRTAMAIWDLVNIVAVSSGLWYLLKTLPLPSVTRSLLLLATITSFPFITNLEQGQSTGLVLFGFAMGIALLRRERDLPAGVMLALLVFKVQWLPFMVLILLWQRRWKALLGLTATTLALLLVVVFTIGTGWGPGFLEVIGKAQTWSRELVLQPWYSHSLSGGLAALLGSGSEKTISTINTVATFLVAALLLLIWRGGWRPGTGRWDGCMGVLVLATIFTNLQVNTHDLCLLSIPAALGISYCAQSHKDSKFRISWYVLLWASYFASSAIFLGFAFNSAIRPITLLIALMLALLAVLLIQRKPTSSRL